MNPGTKMETRQRPWPCQTSCLRTGLSIILIIKALEPRPKDKSEFTSGPEEIMGSTPPYPFFEKK